jgi:hypothetical protein
MCRSHGVPNAFGADAWTAPTRTPPYYPDAVTLAPAADPNPMGSVPGVDPDMLARASGADPVAPTPVPGVDPVALVARIDTAAPGASVKDSFADLDLAPTGFRVLFEAQWIHFPAAKATSPTYLGWEVCMSPEVLRTWAIAWDGGEGNADLFRPELLDEPDVFVFSARSPDGRVIAGAVANRSEQVIGVSNVFAVDGDLDTAWQVVAEAVGRVFPDLPMVGYERGDALDAAVHHGFEPIGPLRVWVRD